jgi:hypothetical protein
MKKSLIICCIISFFSAANAQLSLTPEFSGGVNFVSSYGKRSSNPDVERLLPAHSFAVSIMGEYAFDDSDYSVGFGTGLLIRPVVYILMDQDLSTYSEEIDLSSMTFGYESFYKKQNYKFVDIPVCFKRNYENGLYFNIGIGFKYFLKNDTRIDPYLSRLVLKKFNWTPTIGIGYIFENNLNLMLKAEPEISPFIKTPNTDYKVSFSNYNFMISVGYKLSFK